VHHHAGLLAASKLGMGWPLFAAGLAMTYALIRRADRYAAAPAGPGASQAGQRPGERS